MNCIMDVLVLAKIIKLHVMHTDILRFVYFLCYGISLTICLNKGPKLVMRHSSVKKLAILNQSFFARKFNVFYITYLG